MSGQPKTVKTFGEYSEMFKHRIDYYAAKYSEVHIIFDWYKPLSVKNETRNKRTKNFTPVMRVITNTSVPLPKDWSSYLSMPHNKTDLMRFFIKAYIGK